MRFRNTRQKFKLKKVAEALKATNSVVESVQKEPSLKDVARQVITTTFGIASGIIAANSILNTILRRKDGECEERIRYELLLKKYLDCAEQNRGDLNNCAEHYKKLMNNSKKE